MQGIGCEIIQIRNCSCGCCNYLLGIFRQLPSGILNVLTTATELRWGKPQNTEQEETPRSRSPDAHNFFNKPKGGRGLREPWLPDGGTITLRELNEMV